MKIDWKARFRNYPFYVAVISFIPLTMETWGIGILPEGFRNWAMALLGLFVLIGIVVNPTTKGTSD